MHRTSAGTRLLRRLAAAATTAIFLGSVIGPGLALAVASPTVPDVVVTAPQSATKTGNLLANASGFAGPVVIISHGQFSGGLGSVVITNSTGAYVFTPYAVGSGSISFAVSDGTTTVFASMIVTVNAAPTCSAPADKAAIHDVIQTGAASASCVAHDADAITYAVVGDPPAHAAAWSFLPDGTWSFTPEAGWGGTVSFGFSASDPYQSSGTVTQTIKVNAAPVCATPAESTDGQGVVQGGQYACSDVNSDTMTYALIDAATSGTAVVGSDGTWSYTPTSPTFVGTDSFTFKATDDGTGALESGVVTQTVNVDAGPTCDATTTANGTQDTELTGAASCQANDGDTLDYTIVADGAHGTAIIEPDTGDWTYTPEPGWGGTDSFSYRAGDAYQVSNTVVQNITVNAAPVCTTPVTSGAGQGLEQSGDLACTDAYGGTLTYSLVGAAAHGTAVVNSDGSWTYTPAAVGYTGTDSFTFKATDSGTGLLESSVATMSLTISDDTTLPVVSTPMVALGVGRVSTTAPLRISWGAADIVGIKGYEVQVSIGGAAFTPVYTGTATSTTKSYAFGKSLVFRVRAQDNVNNWSGWTSSATRSLLAYQAPGNSKISFAGTWTSVTSSGSSGGAYRYVSTYGKYAQFRFTGLGVLYVAPKLSSGGYVNVSVDGKLLGKYRTYGATSALGQIIASKSWATSGTHTIKIVDAQTGKRITLDAFVVLR